MNGKRLVQVLLLGVLALTATSSKATSELHKNVKVGLVAEWVFALSAGSDYFFGIVDTGDEAYTVVVDVFSYPFREFMTEGIPVIGGEITTYPAYAMVEAASQDRAVYVVVRPISDAAANVTLRATRQLDSDPFVFGSRDFPVFVWVEAAARRPIPLGLVANTHVWTTEENSQFTSFTGTNDTILMVLQDNYPLAFDDDSGITRMSWLHLFQPCLATGGHTCEILVAQRINDKSGLPPGDPGYDVPSTYQHSRHATLAWDEDVHNGNDQDDDGLGDALETYLQTDPTNKDTDEDGIPDAAEVIGVRDDPSHEETKTNLLRFPYYGAHPKQKDIFVEADWMPCITTPDYRCVTKEDYQYTADQVDLVRGLFVTDPQADATDLYIHMDTGGETCTQPGLCGDWGGAQMYPDGYSPKDYCDGLSPSRMHYFHHIYSHPRQNAQSDGKWSCSVTGNTDPRATAHEIGHHFGLEHYGGHGDGNDQMGGCKPHYMSIMTYAYTDFPDLGTLVPAFSRGDNLGLVLNAAALDENTWGQLPPMSQTVIANRFRRLSVGNGVDWNMDGHISAGLTTGPLNYLPDFSQCDRAAFATREGAFVMRAREPSLVVANGSLWMIAHNYERLNNKDGDFLFIAKADASACKQKQDWRNCTKWTGYPGAMLDSKPIPYAPTAAGSIVAFVSGSKTDGGDLYFMTQPPWEQTSSSSWTPTASVKAGGPKILGQPVATVDPSTGVVSVYAAGTELSTCAAPYAPLMRWDYDPLFKTWTRLGEIQRLSDGSSICIEPGMGPASTRGYQLGGLGANEIQQEYLYMLVSAAGSAGPELKMLRQVTDAGPSLPWWLSPLVSAFLLDRFRVQSWTEVAHDALWTELATSLAGGVPATSVEPSDSRLGLAFLPEPNDSDAPGFVSGRFYMTFVGLGPDGQWYDPLVSFTRGNLFWDGSPASRPAERELALVPFNNFYNPWGDIPTGVPLAYFDGNVRAVAQRDVLPKHAEKGSTTQTPFYPPNVSFFPNADGAVNGEQHDYDDQALIKKNLGCSLWKVCY